MFLVIFLLIALLMPSLSRVRQYSTRDICMAYLSRYRTAGLLYVSDNDGAFPEGTHEWLYTSASVSAAHPLGCRWHDQAMAPSGRIMSSSEAYQGKMWTYFDSDSWRPCPEFRRFASSRGCENPDHNSQLGIRPQYSYTMNGYLGNSQEGGALRLSEVRNPSGVFFFAEENSWTLRPDHPTYRARWLSAPLSTKALDDTVLLIRPGPAVGDAFGTYHHAPAGDVNRGYGNVVFIDGHVESVRAEDQLRRTLHGGNSALGPAGNLHWAWAGKSPPPGGWEAQ